MKRWMAFGFALVVCGLPGSTAQAAGRNAVGFGVNLATVDSDTFFDQEEHGGFSVFGRIGFTDHWGLSLAYRDMEDDEDFFGLEQTYQQFAVNALYLWRPDMLVRPFVEFGLTRTDFEADFTFPFVAEVSDDGVGPSFGGGLEAGSQRVAFIADYQITFVDLEEFDDDATTIADLLLGIVFKF